MFFCYMPAGFNLTTGKGVFIMSPQKKIFGAAAKNTDGAVATGPDAAESEKKLTPSQRRRAAVATADDAAEAIRAEQAALQPGLPF